MENQRRTPKGIQSNDLVERIVEDLKLDGEDIKKAMEEGGVSYEWHRSPETGSVEKYFNAIEADAAWNNYVEKRVIEYMKNLATVEELAREYNMNEETVQRIINEAGIKPIRL